MRTITTDWSLLADHTHGVQFYEDDDVLIELLSGFVGTALVTGDSAVVIATRNHRDALAVYLRKRGMDVTVAQQQGRYVPLDAARTLSKFMCDGRIDAAAFDATMSKAIRAATQATTGSRGRVNAFGEMVALLWADGKVDPAIQIEELWNRLSEQLSFSLCCAYPMKGFVGSSHAAPFLKICALHSHIFPAERRLRATAASA